MGKVKNKTAKALTNRSAKEQASFKKSLRRAQRLVAKYIPPGTRLSEELMAERKQEAAKE